jgi:hypothetical protein
MRKGKDTEWNVYEDNGNTSWEKVGVSVLMDIRDELKRLNSLLACPNFLRIPVALDAIRKNTKKASV